MKIHIRYCKSHALHLIIITIVPSYNEQNITRLLLLVSVLVLRTRNNTDGNKLVIFQYSFVLW